MLPSPSSVPSQALKPPSPGTGSSAASGSPPKSSGAAIARGRSRKSNASSRDGDVAGVEMTGNPLAS